MAKKFYKVISKGKRSTHGGKFNWTKYIPDGYRPGEWTPRIKNIEIHERGYHVTEHWYSWYKKECRVYECECKGLAYVEDRGLIVTAVCEQVRLLKEIEPKFGDDKNTGKWNAGRRNTGDYNKGDYNTGYSNLGDFNCGQANEGSRNAGHNNTGHCNTGSHNIGNHNVGHWNIGHHNVGDFNDGQCNSGDNNVGHWNSGNYNIGNCNTGGWNKGNRHTGYFNAEAPEIVMVFNKPCCKAIWDAAKKPAFLYQLHPSKSVEERQAIYDNAPSWEKSHLRGLPNFDPGVFERATGVKVEISNAEPKEVLTRGLAVPASMNLDDRSGYTDCIRWTGDNLEEVITFCGGIHPSAKKWPWEEYTKIVKEHGLKIFTHNGTFKVDIGKLIYRKKQTDNTVTSLYID